MTCPICCGKAPVYETATDYDCVYRRRRCVVCGHKFVTTEQESKDSYILSSIRTAKRQKPNERTHGDK